MKAYLYIHKGQPVASKSGKPLKRDYLVLRVGWYTDKYKRSLKRWEANLMEVENVVSMRGRERLKISALYYTISDIPPGQQVEIEITENGCKVTKIY